MESDAAERMPGTEVIATADAQRAEAYLRKLALRRAIWASVAVQAVVVLLAVITLCDGPFEYAWRAFVAYWPVAAIIIARRRDRLTELDLGLIRWGFLACMLLVAPVSELVWALMRVKTGFC